MAYTPSSVPVCLRLFIDVLLYLAGCAGVVVLRILVDPLTDGFFCEDTSLQSRRRKDSITTLHLLFGGVAAPLVLILLLEIVVRMLLGRRRSFLSCLLATGKLSGLYLYGLLVCHLVAEVLKVCTGRLRPHFMETCKPDFTAINCTHEFITSYTCTSAVTDMELRDAKKSFPSTKAMWLFYAATFLIFYIEERVEIPFSMLLKSLSQMALMMVAVFCAYTAVVDRRHHLSDVVIGALLGVLIGLWVLFWVAKHMRRETVFSSVYKVPPIEVSDEIALTEHRAHQQKVVQKPLGSPSPSSRTPTSATSRGPPLLSQA